jgi:hypothetical protein
MNEPEVGAECGNSARSDLCGGRPESKDEGSSLPRSSMQTFVRSRRTHAAPDGWKKPSIDSLKSDPLAAYGCISVARDCSFLRHDQTRMDADVS